METLANIPIIAFADAAAWKSWLDKNHTDPIGVWVKIAKKHSGIQSISYAEALDEALCYGWIDGLKRSYDELYFLQKFTPRRKRSLWSKVNIGKVEALIAAGRMQSAGMTQIELAKADGRWDAAYESQTTATAPDDLITALEQNPDAKTFFASLTKAEKYSVLWRLMTATSPAIRSKRLTSMVESLSAHKKIGS